MHKPFFFLAFLFCLNTQAQENLVLNPSFEDTASMTDGWPYLITSNWWNPNGYSTDYFSPYCEELCCGGGAVLCPDEITYLGIQPAQHGTSYLGLVVYESTSEGKDYAEGLLSEPLQQSESYCIGIWISLADSSALKSCDFQVSFTTESIQDGQALNLMLQNGVSFDISEIDTASWTYFEGSYTALGGEQYIYLGSNTPNSELTCVEQVADTWLWNTSYILVDNVSVKATKLCEVSAEEILETSVVLVYPNPTTGIVDLQPGIEGKWELKIYSYNGTLLRYEKHSDSNQRIDISSLSSSVYMFEISDSNGTFRTRVMKE